MQIREAPNPFARVRFSPTPTSQFHVGLARTALVAWLLARATEGKFILRIDDAAPKRRDLTVRPIYEALTWLGLHWDEGPDVGGDFGPYRQSQRMSEYRFWSEWLIDRGLAYRCICPSERLKFLWSKGQSYDGSCRGRKHTIDSLHAIRLNVEPGETVVHDGMRGKIVFRSHPIDPIILRQDGCPTYQFAYVIDDHFMNINYAIRDGRISSTQIMVLLYKALGWEMPIFIHLGHLLLPDRSGKLTSCVCDTHFGPLDVAYVDNYKNLGISPTVILNLLARTCSRIGSLSWIYDLDDLVSMFNVSLMHGRDVALPVQEINWLCRLLEMRNRNNA
jgi:glutamyl/glutaminyl-tRNA synthetase